MPSSDPLVSIFLPTYNQMHWVGEAIDSCLSQTYPHIEIVVSDDASTDATWDVITQRQDKHPNRIHAHRNSHNLGVTANCNALLRRCRGKYVAFFAGDDLMYPTKLEEQVRFLESNDDYAICAHDVDILVEGCASQPWKWHDAIPLQSGAVELYFRDLCFTCGCSVMARRDLIPDGGYLPPIIAADWLLFVETMLSQSLQLKVLDKVLGAYRRRSGQLTETKSINNLGLFADHAFACGYLYAKYESHRTGAALAFKNWKQNLLDHIKWYCEERSFRKEFELLEKRCTSPRFLAKQMITAVVQRVFKKRSAV